MSNVIPLPSPEPAAEERPVLVLDLGGQYAQLIARGLPEIGVVHPNLTLEGLRIVGNLND